MDRKAAKDREMEKAKAEALAEEEALARAEKMQVVKGNLMAGILPDVHVVDEVEEAHRVCKLLMTQHKDCVFACDTEVRLGSASCAWRSQIEPGGGEAGAVLLGGGGGGL